MVNWKAFLPAMGWGLVILYLSAGPGISLPVDWWKLFSPDKVGHLVVYAILSFLLLKGFQDQKNDKPQTAVFSLLIASIYGIAMEGMQYSFFPGRYFEVLDIIANIIGAILGLLLFRKFSLKSTY